MSTYCTVLTLIFLGGRVNGNLPLQSFTGVLHKSLSCDLRSWSLNESVQSKVLHIGVHSVEGQTNMNPSILICTVRMMEIPKVVRDSRKHRACWKCFVQTNSQRTENILINPKLGFSSASRILFSLKGSLPFP